jgi:hypothetical protein
MKVLAKCKKAIAIEEEDKASMYLQQQQTSSEAARPRLALTDDAPYQHQPRPSPLSLP